MSRPAAEIDDAILLNARIGYRTFLKKNRNGACSPDAFYDGFNEAEPEAASRTPSVRADRTVSERLRAIFSAGSRRPLVTQ